MLSTQVEGNAGNPVVVNAALAAKALFIVRLQVVPEPNPAQAPPHPLKVWPANGVSVNVTLCPAVKLAEHVGWQLIPDGELDTEPKPVVETVRTSLPEDVTATQAARV